jgi:CubicO group peptidase (beta-lactamase class C family)
MKEWTSEIRKKDFSLDSLISFFKNQPMDFEPGTKWSYSNSGYILLGKIIQRENLEKAFIPYKTSDGKSTKYGYGWMMGEIDGTKVILHGGGINGFLTMGLWIPEEEVFVAVFSNCESQSPDNAALKLAAMTIGKLPEYKPLTADSLTLSRYAGIYENGNDVQRIITLKGGKLWSQRTG